MTEVVKILPEKFLPVTIPVTTASHVADQIKMQPQCISKRVR